METAQTPFNFFTVSYLTRIGNRAAWTLSEFLAGLEHCSDASIFHHTFQTLSSHHFLTEGFSNDFAQWVLADAIHQALDMSSEQQAVRMARLRKTIREYNIFRWAANLLSDLTEIRIEAPDRNSEVQSLP